MGLPLQPELRPLPAWQRRLLMVSMLVLAVGLVGWLARPLTPPPRLVVTGADGHDGYPQVVERLVRRARERVWVMVYVCYPERSGDGPVSALCRALGRARARGVDVRVILDVGHRWGTDVIEDKHRQGAAFLHAQGVPVVLDELERTSHAKLVLVDDEHCVIGSHNWTRSAFVRNREVSTWHRDPRMVAELEGLFLAVPGFATASLGPAPAGSDLVTGTPQPESGDDGGTDEADDRQDAGDAEAPAFAPTFPTP